MARIAGITLPADKRVEIGLTYIFGIGRSLSARLLKEASINPDMKVSALTDEQVNRLRDIVGRMTVEGDLRRKVTQDIKRLQEIGSYRGYRHRRNLPARGQRTRTNARTKRGKRKTMGSGKSKLTKT